MLSVRLLKCSKRFLLNTNYIRYATAINSEINSEKVKFENVFSFPFIKNIALVNRLKIYQFFGSFIVVPSCGIMEMLNVLPQNSFLSAAYIGVTGIAVFSFFTLPLKNIIGQLYISEDNKQIKISYLDYFGKRIDKTVKVDDWIPLLEIKPKTTDAFYLTPELTDGTKYKLFIKFGIVRNSEKMGHVLE